MMSTLAYTHTHTEEVMLKQWMNILSMESFHLKAKFCHALVYSVLK